jgi:glutamyl-tRNA synthetase
MSMQELVELFDLNRCSKAGAKFDYKKASGLIINIFRRSNEDVATLFLPVLKAHGVEAPFEKVATIVGNDERACEFCQ